MFIVISRYSMAGTHPVFKDFQTPNNWDEAAAESQFPARPYLTLPRDLAVGKGLSKGPARVYP
jgi:hypothetical protein